MLGFAFYVQPMLMPLLHEMPAGELGVSLMTTAVRVVTMGEKPPLLLALGFSPRPWMGPLAGGHHG